MKTLQVSLMDFNCGNEGTYILKGRCMTILCLECEQLQTTGTPDMTICAIARYLTFM